MDMSLIYVILAIRAYLRNNINKPPLPEGWTEVEEPQNTSSGFSAGVYQNGNEIVIAYTGTDEKFDWITGNIPAYTGDYSLQVEQAMILYKQIEAKYNENGDKTVSFTGHSLGGGLAALMAVFFKKYAITFDGGPFGRTLTSIRNTRDFYGPKRTSVLEAYRTEFTRKGFADFRFDVLVDNFGDNATNSIRSERMSHIYNYSVFGDVLENIRNIETNIGTLTSFLGGGKQTASPINLHSISLLASLLYSDKFGEMGRKVEDSFSPFFDLTMFARETDRTKPNQANLLDKLLIAQVGDSNRGVQPILLLQPKGVSIALFPNLKIPNTNAPSPTH